VTAKHVVVHGGVQGVGFRWFAREEAARLGITGWIRNRDDGTVEAVEGAHGWIVGVQWHPEDTAGNDPQQQGIFHAFVAASRQAVSSP